MQSHHRFPLGLDPALMESSRGRFRRFIEHPFGWPVAVFIVLVVVSSLMLWWLLARGSGDLTIPATDTYIAIVHHDGITQTVPTNEKTVGSLLKRLHITVEPTDRVEPALDADITNDNFLINVYRSAPVSIVVDGKTVLVNSAAATPRSVVAQAGVTLYSEDRVTAALTDNFLFQGSLGYRAMVDRAMPVSLELYGQPIEVRTHAKTVAQLLKEKDIKLTKDDTVRPGLDTALSAGMKLAVVRNGIQVITVDETTPFPIQTIIDMSLSFGSQAVRQEGVPGKITNTYEINVQDGIEVSRKLIQSVKVVDAVPRIIAKGNTVNIPADKQAVMAAAGISVKDYAYVDYIFSHESHWNTAAISSTGKYVGLGQTTRANLSGTCPNWETDAVCQARWFSNYATSRYGSWEGAYNKWLRSHWW